MSPERIKQVKRYKVVDTRMNAPHSGDHSLFFALALCRDLNRRNASPGRYAVRVQ